MEKKYKNIISTIIKNIKIEDDKFILETDNGEFYALIVKGSILCTIKTFEKKIMPISYLENNDIVKIKLTKSSDATNIIEKIYVNTKYDIISESSSEDYIS
jgi:hypothetical protein